MPLTPFDATLRWREVIYPLTPSLNAGILFTLLAVPTVIVFSKYQQTFNLFSTHPTPDQAKLHGSTLHDGAFSTID
jgi:hypothetical protein